MATTLPSYLNKLSISELHTRAEILFELLRECKLCPRQCKAKRLEGRYGVCRVTDKLVISSASPHFGEEPPLVGQYGSGTIFFSSCNLKCLYCQNYEISHLKNGTEITTNQLANLMIRLQECKCHNINLVTPTHFTPFIVDALIIAIKKGLKIPIVYNCGGYESVETIKLLENIIDIYMPDIKYGNNVTAVKYSGAKDYWDVVKRVLKEMYKQTGDLKINELGIAEHGLLIRHLVLPNRLADTENVMRFIATEISKDSYVNIMNQYHPAYKAWKIPELNRIITKTEYDVAISYALEAGLYRGFAK